MIFRAVAGVFPGRVSAFRAFIVLELPDMAALTDAVRPQEGTLMMCGAVGGWPDRTRGTALDLYVRAGCEDGGRPGWVVWSAPLFDSDVIDPQAGPPYETREWRVKLNCSPDLLGGYCIGGRHFNTLPVVASAT